MLISFLSLFLLPACLFAQQANTDVLKRFDDLFTFPSGFYRLQIRNKLPAKAPNNNDPYYSPWQRDVFLLRDAKSPENFLYLFRNSYRNIHYKVLVEKKNKIYLANILSNRLYYIQEKERMQTFFPYTFSYLDFSFFSLAKHYRIPEKKEAKQFPKDTRFPSIAVTPESELDSYLLLSKYPEMQVPKKKEKGKITYKFFYRKLVLLIRKKTKLPFRLDYYRDGELFKSAYFSFATLPNKSKQRDAANERLFPSKIRMVDLLHNKETVLEFYERDSSKVPSPFLFRPKNLLTE